MTGGPILWKKQPHCADLRGGGSPAGPTQGWRLERRAEEDVCFGPSVSWRRFPAPDPSSPRAPCLESLRSFASCRPTPSFGALGPDQVGGREKRAAGRKGLSPIQPGSPPGLWIKRSVGAATLQSLVVVARAGQWGRGIEEDLSPGHMAGAVYSSGSPDSSQGLGLGSPTFLPAPFPWVVLIPI